MVTARVVKAARDAPRPGEGPIAAPATKPVPWSANEALPKKRDSALLYRAHRAALVVAKDDRLARSQSFLSRILEAGVDVRSCDLPRIEGPTGRFLLQSMMAVAELEAGMISARTRKRTRSSPTPAMAMPSPAHKRSICAACSLIDLDHVKRSTRNREEVRRWLRF